jgi:replicative DNA helicase
VIDTEKAVLGSMLAGAGPLAKAFARGIEEKDFASIQNKLIFKAILSLKRDGVNVDLITVKDRLSKMSWLDKVGGPAYLAALDWDTPDVEMVGNYVSLVKASRLRREVGELGQKMKLLAQNKGDPSEKILGRVRSWVNKLVSPNEFKQAINGIELSKQVERRVLLGKNPVIPTGYVDLDERFGGGLEKGNYYVIAGRPGMGKTSLALNMLWHMGSSGVGCYLFSLEMSAEELGLKLMTLETKIPGNRMKQGGLSEAEIEGVKLGSEGIAELSLMIDDTGKGITAESILNEIEGRRLAGDKIEIVVIDYMQLMEGRGGNRTEEMSFISRGLKTVAREGECALVAVSQLSRRVEHRKSKRPELGDLRESGAIEQDAHAVVLMYRPGYYQAIDKTQGKTELIIAKNRTGATGVVRVKWLAAEGRFKDESVPF